MYKRQGIFLLSAVAGSVAVAVCNGPCHGQGALLVLTEISHTKDACAVGIGIEVAQGLFLGIGQAVQGYAGSVGAAPLRIGEDIETVSYTHLDVYKRQFRHRALPPVAG